MLDSELDPVFVGGDDVGCSELSITVTSVVIVFDSIVLSKGFKEEVMIVVQLSVKFGGKDTVTFI